MTKPPMSDAEIRRRKKVQGEISRTTSTLGLTGLGLIGAAGYKSGALKKLPKAAKAVNAANLKKLPKRVKTASPEQLKQAATTTAIVSGGIGGIGGYNFAAYTNAESRKRAMEPKKIKKAWSPVVNSSSPERKRQQRNKVYEGAAYAGAAGGGGYAAHQGFKAAGTLSRLKSEDRHKITSEERTVRRGYTTKKGTSVAPKTVTDTTVHAAEKTIPTKPLVRGLKSSGKAAAGVGVVAASATYLGSKKKKSFESYSKSANTSAFGVVHD